MLRLCFCLKPSFFSKKSETLFLSFFLGFSLIQWTRMSFPLLPHGTQSGNAIDELAPSCPPSTSTEPWNIFINHRGKDVKHTLATAIHHKLHSLGFHVFLDKDALHPGDSFPAEIKHAIATATFHIAIFSPDYAESAWCLAELSDMLKTGKKIIPIFWKVEPFELRWTDQRKGKRRRKQGQVHTRTYATAFLEHEKKGRYTQEQLAEWRNSLYQVSNLDGYVVKDNEGEATVLKDVVNLSQQIMKTTPFSVAKHPVGLDELVRGFDLVSSKEEVRITGIVGMGGSGKTTLAKELYNRNFSSFQRCSFVSNVRDAANKNALCERQKKLLSDLGLDASFDDEDEGKSILTNRLRSHKVLIILDDVDHIDQLDALLPIKQELGHGSIVIVTTREKGVLMAWDLDCIYHMSKLAYPHDKQLLCRHAFPRQHSPLPEYEILIKSFLEVCGGLPLALKVMGALLAQNSSIHLWECLLNKVNRKLPCDIENTLKVSYDALDDEEKEMFLDSACFFIGEEKSTVVAVWDGSGTNGWSGLIGLKTLVDKCLVELEEEEGSWFGEKRIVIKMHDLLRDMGRAIASGHSPYRIWCLQQITDLNKDSTMRKQIRGIHPVVSEDYMNYLMANAIEQSHYLAFSNELQILSMKGDMFKEKFAALWAGLVWLRWTDSPRRSLPSWLTFKKLRVLELYAQVPAYAHSQVKELFADNADLPLVSREIFVLTTPYAQSEVKELWADNADLPLQLRELILHGYSLSSFRHLQHLKRLEASCCKISLSEEFCGLKSLQHLKLRRSYELSSLPDSFGKLTSLRYLDLSDSDKLSVLPNSFTQLTCLEDLNLEGCRELSSLPPDFGNLRRLRNVNLNGCRELIMLPHSFTQLTCLEDLNLECCRELSSLPPDIANLRRLRNVNLDGCEKLIMLPDSFTQLTRLKSLVLIQCERLRSLPCSLHLLINLERFHVEEAPCLVEIENLPVSLKFLEIDSCKSLKKISWISGPKKLETLVILGCPELEEIPSFAELALLIEFQMDFGPKVKNIEGFEHAKSLKDLSVRCMCRVRGMESLENVERLNMVCLSCENNIKDVIPSILSMKGKEFPKVVEIGGGVEDERTSKNCLEFLDAAAEEVGKTPPEYTLQCFCSSESEGNHLEISCFPRSDINTTDEMSRIVEGERGSVAEMFYGLMDLLQ